MTTKGEGKTDAILYAVFMLVCLGWGLLLHILSARSVPGVFKFLVGALFVLSGVVSLAGIFKAVVWTVKACRAYRTEYRKLAVVASLVVVVVVTAVVVHHLTANPIQQYWPTNRVVLSQLITVDDQIMAISDRSSARLSSGGPSASP
jgi:hypothetical protein